MRLSICIPTYNRAKYLANCLASIAKSARQSSLAVEVCVSDNASTDETPEVVRAAQRDMPIVYSRNPENLGIPRNFLRVVDMASGEFVWMLGDDDMVLPDALERLRLLFESHPRVDFFYVNACHLHARHLADFPHPFDTANLPAHMTPFSTRQQSGELPFLDLIDPDVSFDFLGGIFLSVFRREPWTRNVHVLDPAIIADPRSFSHFDNTFPHVKIFAHAFARSTAYFEAAPLSVCLGGLRDWAPMYPMIHSVRLVEALECYRANGLPYFRYLRCRNFALNNFFPDLGFMLVHREVSGLRYVNPFMLFVKNALYPNVYFSVIYYLRRKLRRARGTAAA